MDADTGTWGRRPTDHDERPAWAQPPAPPPSGGGRGLFPLLLSALVAAVVSALVTLGLIEARQGAGTPAVGGAQEQQEEPGEGVDRVANRDEPAQEPLADGSAISEVAERVLPSVSQVRVQTGQGGGEGSAVVYSEDGLLVTNNHVVENARRVEVVLSDLGTYEAEVVGTDPFSDLALLRIDETGLPVPEYADEVAPVGSTAIAIGSPFGLASTVTSGIVSAEERDIPAESGFSLIGLIQTDAAINPGNSGGALVDDQGRIIGINTAIFSQTGANSGVGFAIPVSTVQDVAEKLRRGEEVEYAYLGVSTGEVSNEVAERFDLEDASGALVVDVVQGGPAQEAGLRPGDILTRIGDRTIEEAGDVSRAVLDYEPGDEATVTFLREGRQEQAEITFGTRPDQVRLRG
jgi:S1-C subfamily serine protease